MFGVPAVDRHMGTADFVYCSPDGFRFEQFERSSLLCDGECGFRHGIRLLGLVFGFSPVAVVFPAAAVCRSVFAEVESPCRRQVFFSDLRAGSSGFRRMNVIRGE